MEFRGFRGVLGIFRLLGVWAVVLPGLWFRVHSNNGESKEQSTGGKRNAS